MAETCEKLVSCALQSQGEPLDDSDDFADDMLRSLDVASDFSAANQLSDEEEEEETAESDDSVILNIRMHKSSTPKW